ncbi:MAG: hypothetical protein KGM24_08540, partial [Elusimicrobia bacterium]|nr:hypothetical protein [Elusimicrobiota bacterium]
MRRWALALLLTPAGTAHAALPRVVLEAPPAPAGPAALPVPTTTALAPLSVPPAPALLAPAPSPAAAAPVPVA